MDVIIKNDGVAGSNIVFGSSGGLDAHRRCSL
jgi:hypothetical protein